MSTSIDDLYVTLTGDAAPLLAAFAQATTAGEAMASAITASLAEVQAAMAESLAGVGVGDTAGIAALGTEAEAAAAQVGAATAEMDSSISSVGAAADAMGTTFDATLARMQAQIAATDAEMAKLSDETAGMSAKMATDNAALATSAAEAGTATAAVGDAMAGTSSKASQANTTLGVSNTTLMALGAAAIGAAYESVKMAGDFQAAVTRLATSAGESQQNLQMVGNGILAMAGQVGYSSDQLAQAMYTVESGGQHGADGLKTLQAAAQGAKTENADLGTVADAVTSALKDYHLTADDAATVTSKLVAATSQGKTSFEELAGAMSNILPVASADHVSLDDILGDLSSMTVHGESAQQASQNLADALRHLASPTQAQSKELAALGLNATQVSMDLGSKGLSGTIQEIATAIQNQMGPGTQEVVLNLTNALKGLPPQVQQLGQQVLNGTMTMAQFTAAVKGLDPISAKQAQSFATLAGTMHTIGTESMSGAQVMQSYSGAMQKAMGDASGLNVALMLTGENSQTTANDIQVISQATADASGNVKGWDEIQGNFNQKIDEAKDAFGAMAISIGEKLLPVLTVVAGVFTDVFNFLASHQTVAVALAVVIGGTLTLAFGALSLAMGKWVVSAARGFADTMADAAVSAASTAASATMTAAAWVATNAKMLASQLADGAVWLATWIAQGVAAAASSVAEAAVAAAAWVAANATMIVATGGVVLAIGAVIAIGYELITHWQQVQQVAGEVWNAVTSAVSNMYNAVSGMISGLIGMFSNAASWLVNAGYNIVVGLWNGIASGWSWLEGQVSSLASSLLSAAKSALGISSPSRRAAEEVGQPFSAGVGQGVTEGADQAVAAAQQMINRVTAVASGTVNTSLTASSYMGSAGAGGLATGITAPAATVAPVINVNVNVAGSVLAEHDLVQAVQQGLLRHGIRNASSGISYSFG